MTVCARTFMTSLTTPGVILTTVEALESSWEPVGESGKAEMTAQGPNKAIKVDCVFPFCFLKNAIVHVFMSGAFLRCRVFCSLRVGWKKQTTKKQPKRRWSRSKRISCLSVRSWVQGICPCCCHGNTARKHTLQKKREKNTLCGECEKARLLP